MDEEIERLVVSVRADTRAFARDVAEMREAIEGPLTAGADRAGRAIENALLRAVRTGKLGFEDLRRMALGVMDGIARDAIGGGFSSLMGGSGGGRGGGAGGLLNGLLSMLSGAPGRATGGPVSPGRAYRVGERGPELFVPTSAGQVVAPRSSEGGRDVRVSITIHPGASAPAAALTRSSRQVAQAVRAALQAAD